MTARPAALATLPDAAARAVRGVLTDIDDTLTSEGAIAPEALAALGELRAAGVPVIAVTGRPKGWSEAFARDWPIEAIVAENGAVALFRDDAPRATEPVDDANMRTVPGEGAHGPAGPVVGSDVGLVIEYAQDEPTRRRNAARLRAAAARVLREVPGSRLAADSAGRVTDIAIDHSEFAHLPPERIAAVVAVMRDEGMNATVSSIHINGWYGDHDKLSGARWIVRRRLGRDLDAETADWVYVGDSTNDQHMFGHFPLSVGVANLLRFAAELTVWPRYLTQGERGAGFAEVARRLLQARR
jgi:hydroxymethylpyrimidine pyrophosphatase-like HAD family hydrolase